MSTDRTFNERNRDMQDGFERHIWGEKEYVSGAGSVIRVKGTGTEDFEAAVVNMGHGFNLPKDSNAEVMLLAGGSDTQMKFAILTLPRDKQREWAEGTGGIQHPTNPDRAIEFNGTDTWLKDGTFVLGDARAVTITVNGDNVTISTGKLVINADVEINGAYVRHNGTPIDDTHTHGGVEPGGGDTSVPNGA